MGCNTVGETASQEGNSLCEDAKQQEVRQVARCHVHRFQASAVSARPSVGMPSTALETGRHDTLKAPEDRGDTLRAVGNRKRGETVGLRGRR